MKGKIVDQDYDLGSHDFFKKVTGENPESYLKSQHGGRITTDDEWDFSRFVENIGPPSMEEPMPPYSEEAFQAVRNLLADGDWNEMDKIYRKLCQNLESNTKISELKGMVRAMDIDINDKTKVDLCSEIGAKILLKRLGLAPL